MKLIELCEKLENVEIQKWSTTGLWRVTARRVNLGEELHADGITLANAILILEAFASDGSS